MNWKQLLKITEIHQFAGGNWNLRSNFDERLKKKDDDTIFFFGIFILYIMFPPFMWKFGVQLIWWKTGQNGQNVHTKIQAPPIDNRFFFVAVHRDRDGVFMICFKKNFQDSVFLWRGFIIDGRGGEGSDHLWLPTSYRPNPDRNGAKHSVGGLVTLSQFLFDVMSAELYANQCQNLAFTQTKNVSNPTKPWTTESGSKAPCQAFCCGLGYFEPVFLM